MARTIERSELRQPRTDRYDPATLAAAQDARDEGLAERETGRKTA